MIITSIIASSVTTASVIIAAMATSTSASVITVIIARGVTSMRIVEMSTVVLILSPVIVLLFPSPLLETSVGSFKPLWTSIGSTASIATYVVLIMIVIVGISILLFILGRGWWLRLLLFGFTFSQFLSSFSFGTFKWLGDIISILILRLCHL